MRGSDKTAVSIIVASFGEGKWKQLGDQRALPSAVSQGADEVIRLHQPDGTLASCRNAAAEQARGDWLLYLDADDELAPNFLQHVIVAYQASGVTGDVLVTPAVEYRYGRRPTPPKIWPAIDLRDGNYLVIGTLVPRRLFFDVGGFEDWDMYEDWALFARCWKAGAVVVEAPAAHYIAHASPRSRNRAPSRADKLRVHHEIRRAVFPELYEAVA